MQTNNLEQLYLFLIFIVIGIILGFVFDLFRISRLSFKTIDFITHIEDLIFALFLGSILAYTIFICNNGEIRFYFFIGVLNGISGYYLLLSKYVVKIGVKIVIYIKKILKFIANFLIYPFKIVYKLLKKLFGKQISFLFINIRVKILKSFKSRKIIVRK